MGRSVAALRRGALLLTLLGAMTLARGARGEDAGARALAYAIEPPDDWRELPGVASAARAAAGDHTRAAAWGDPSLGVFALALDSASEGLVVEPTEAARAALVGALAGIERAGILVTDVARQDRERWLTLRASLGHGRLRGQVVVYAAVDRGGAVRAATAACLHDQRHPALTAGACTRLLDRFRLALGDAELMRLTPPPKPPRAAP